MGSVAFATLQETVVSEETALDQSQYGWMCADLIAQMKGYPHTHPKFNDVVQTIQTTFKSRQSEDPILMALNEQEYWYSHDMHFASVKKSKLQEAVAESGAKETDYDSWAGHVDGSAGSSSSSSKPGSKAAPALEVAPWKLKQIELVKVMARLDKAVQAAISEGVKVVAVLKNADEPDEMSTAGAVCVDRGVSTLESFFKGAQAKVATLSWHDEATATKSNESLENTIKELKCHYDQFEKCMRGPRKMVE